MFRHPASPFLLGMFWGCVWTLLTATGCAIQGEPPTVIAGAEVRFTQSDRERILEYYRQFEYPPGIQKPSMLSPDLEERISRTGKIPPGVAGMPLPAELEEELSELPPGYSRFRVGDDVVLFNIALREVLDIVPDVIR